MDYLKAYGYRVLLVSIGDWTLMAGFCFCYHAGRFLVVRARHFVGQAEREPEAGRDLVKLVNENFDWVEHEPDCVGCLSPPYLFYQKSSFLLSVRILISGGCSHRQFCQSKFRN